MFHALENFWIFLVLQILAQISICVTVARYKKVLLAFFLIDVICIVSVCLSYAIFVNFFTRKIALLLVFLVVLYVDLWCNKFLVDYSPALTKD